MIICAVRDVAASVYGNPFCVSSQGAAVRSFINEINSRSPESVMAAHYKDFDLYKIGEFDEATGIVVSFAPELLLRGTVARREDTPNNAV